MSNENFVAKINFQSAILLLIIVSQGISVQHGKMMCSIQSLVCMFKATGHNQNTLNFPNQQRIIISLEISDHHD